MHVNERLRAKPTARIDRMKRMESISRLKVFPKEVLMTDRIVKDFLYDVFCF